jgi:hypothetical protein
VIHNPMFALGIQDGRIEYHCYARRVVRPTHGPCHGTCRN